MNKAKKKTKVLLILTAVVLTLVIGYCAVWLLFYANAIKPHLSDKLKEDTTVEGNFTVYSTDFDAYDNLYSIFVPQFGNFTFYCGMSSSISVADDVQCNANGSAFDYSMIAEFDLFGKIKSYKFNVQPMPSKEEYAYAALCILDENGELLNAGDMTEKEIAIYEDAKPEMLEYIRSTNDNFNIA